MPMDLASAAPYRNAWHEPRADDEGRRAARSDDRTRERAHYGSEASVDDRASIWERIADGLDHHEAAMRTKRVIP